jgi:hypothetical protein
MGELGVDDSVHTKICGAGQHVTKKKGRCVIKDTPSTHGKYFIPLHTMWIEFATIDSRLVRH